MTEHVLVMSAGALLLYMVALWILSLWLRDVSIADPGWGLGFVIVSLVSLGLGEGAEDRRLLITP